jgi:uncharacterized protein YndB with AHSA1/START domain
MSKPLSLLLAGIAFSLWAPFAAAAERSIDKEVIVDATLDLAWEAWTTREGITSFFAPDAKIEPQVGGAFQIYMDPTAPLGSRGADDMRVMALQPKQMLSFDWNAPPSPALSPQLSAASLSPQCIALAHRL